MLQIVVLLGAILALLNVLGYTAISWWIVGALIVVPICVAMIPIIGILGAAWWVNKD